jgi:hypothetical protein
MSKKKSADFEKIIERKFLVEFNRKPLEKSKSFGFVLACNDEFTLVHEFDRDSFALNGYCIFRNDSVKKYAVYDDEDYFLNEVIRLKKIEPKPVPEISIENWSSILQTVNANFPLIRFEREKISDKVCFIGKLDKLKKKTFSLRGIDPSADWEGLSSFKYDDLTKVGFDSAYENTLILVAEHRDKTNREKY